MSSSYKLPPGYPPVRNPVSALMTAFSFQRDFFGTLEESFARYGDIFGVDIMGSRQYLIRHPDHIHEVTTRQADKFQKETLTYKDGRKGLARFLGNGLLTSDGDFWKRQRKLLAPAFHYRRIASYGDIMVQEASAIVEDWRHASKVDVDAEMMRATLSIVARALFSSEMSDEDVHRIGNAMSVIQHFSGDQVQQLLPAWLPTPARFREEAALRDLDGIVYRVIAEHRAMEKDNGDLLWMLLDARDDEGQGMTDQQIRDELVTLFLAGHDTTAHTLNWTWVLLAQNPEKEAKLHEELDRVVAGRMPNLDDLKQLPYTEMVIKESMRIYPPAFVFSREAIADTQIGGYDIPAGSVMTIMSRMAHLDPRWYPEPLRFQPERWTPEFESSLPKGAYIPFGGGPRVCIGNSFAMMEAQLMLATIAQNYRLHLTGDAPEPEPLLTLRPRGGLHMRIEARQPVQMPLTEVQN